jgi:predicted transcriptional regulator
MTNGITKSMKTAISVEDSLLEQADKAARDLGLSRSGLIAQALREYLARRRQARISEKLNQAYANEPGPDERQLVRKLRTKLPAPDRW